MMTNIIEDINKMIISGQTPEVDGVSVTSFRLVENTFNGINDPIVSCCGPCSTNHDDLTETP